MLLVLWVVAYKLLSEPSAAEYDRVEDSVSGFPRVPALLPVIVKLQMYVALPLFW